MLDPLMGCIQLENPALPGFFIFVMSDVTAMHRLQIDQWI